MAKIQELLSLNVIGSSPYYDTWGRHFYTCILFWSDIDILAYVNEEHYLVPSVIPFNLVLEKDGLSWKNPGHVLEKETVRSWIKKMN